MMRLAETAFAKINLTLEILGRRGDGMHELRSLVTFAEIGDPLRLEEGPVDSGRLVSLRVEGPFADEIVGENLVERAIRAVEQAAGQPMSVDIVLDKTLPVASGIGGGSADAAACLRLLRTAMGVSRERIDWEAIARRLGADVPVCLASKPAMMTGTGEHLKPISLPRLDIVLANPREPVPSDKTRQVFQALAAGPICDAASARMNVPGDRVALIALMRTVGNDLERPASLVLPAVSRVKAAVAQTRGCEIAVLSGAGPTVVGVYDSASSAAAAAQALSQAHPAWWVRATSTRTA